MAKKITKQWWKSKSIWAGVIILATGVAGAFGLNVPVEAIITIAGGVGIVGLRQAIEQK